VAALRTPTPATVRRRAAHRRRADTQAAILAATEELLRHHRWAALSVDDVAGAAGIARTAFYRFFPDLGTVLRQLLTDLVADITARGAAFWQPNRDDPAVAGAGPRAALEAAAAGTVAVFRQHHHLIRAFVDAAAADDDLDAAYRRAVGLVVAATAERIRSDQRAGLVDGDLDAGQLAEALVWMSERFLSMTYGALDDRPVDDDAAAATVVTIWWRTLYHRCP
jgi:AcrR family transcriptional regulator